MLPLQLAGPPTMLENHLMSDENLSNLTIDEAVSLINQLMAEIAQLKTTVQQTNASMKMAVDSFTQLQARTKRDEEENLQFYNKSRTVVQELKKNIADRDHVIETLRKQIQEGPVMMMQPSDEIKQLENENRKLTNEIDELKQKSTKQEYTLTSENNMLKMQLTTILTNHETAKQNFLQEKTQIENKCLNLEGHLQKMQIEEQKKLESLKMQNEKVNAELTNVSRKYEQLMSDYHDLLTSNDQQKNTQSSQAVLMKVDFESRIDNLTAQLVTAEEVLNQKQDQIRMLIQKLNDLEPLQAQVAIYKADFEAERRSREEINDRYLELSEKCQRLERSVNPHVPGHPAHVPRLHHLPSGPAAFQAAAAAAAAGPYAPRPVTVDRIPGPVVSPVRNPNLLPFLRDQEPEPDLKCPICSHICPDFDSLQLHVNDCLNE